MTQEQIGMMLGARREGITVAAGHLQNAGLIKYPCNQRTDWNEPCQLVGMVSNPSVLP